MEIKFWGVRGSIASPGPETAAVGGNTSCVEVRCGSSRIILDAGTGVRKLGDALLREGPVEATVLLSHLHWDHIQGLPFFVPAYLPSSRLSIVGSAHGIGSLREVLSTQMAAPSFPVRMDELGAQIAVREARPGEAFDVGEVHVRIAKLNHPGGVLAYRVEHEGRSVVYATDTEHYACVDPALRALADGADVLIYDAQYTPEEYRGDGGRSKVGWGHSTYVAGAEIARACGARKLVLFHHDPQRTDAGVAEIERLSRELFPASVAAREGLCIHVEALARAA
ncbi:MULTISPECIES: MBL fold metallo-hydrolase [Sorangium]|uniref:MBL fold metallo-hydrolase n=1 Tax=Sorangium atrum TaxID=2995308 RepID=A0ABT5C031_9BACT|nr:MBL fold metallo-hydrolase [Sorangium aterium]MDC0679770.1 MBL fold metallo-hydrolase [Sorangium aterium]